MSCNVCRGYDSHDCPVCGIESSVERCPVCSGTGIDQRLAFNIKSREFVKVTEIAWLMLPKTEDEAEARGQNYCRAEDNCPFCKGLGEVRKEGDAYYPLY